MSQIGFFCPDGVPVKFEECLKKCRMVNRCVSTPVLKMLSKQRVWVGLPSTTQLICGTREAFLKITKEYYEEIQKLAWILLGNRIHKSLEDADTEGNSEIAFKNKIHSGIADYYEESQRILYDRKVSGAYKVHKALGLVAKKVPDPSGARYKRAGKGYKAGDIKKINMWYTDPNAVDMWEWIMQTNRYAIWLEDSSKPVEKIIIEVIVRDGGLKVAASYGIDRNIVLINIPILKKEYILDYFDRKAKMLRSAIAISWAPKCSDKECWGGRKCEGYCPVAHFCRQMPTDHSSKSKFAELEPKVLC